MKGRLGAAALMFAGGLFLALSVVAPRAVAADQSHHDCSVLTCPPTPIQLFTPSPTSKNHDPAASPAPTGAVQAAVAAFQAYPTPTDPPKSDVPASGFAESAAVTQPLASAEQFATVGIPANNDTFSSAPGFGPIGIPMLLVFALLGLGSYSLRKRL